LGIVVWGLRIAPNPQSPIPNPQSPIPNPLFFIYFINIILLIFVNKYIFKRLIYFWIFKIPFKITCGN